MRSRAEGEGRGRSWLTRVVLERSRFPTVALRAAISRWSLSEDLALSCVAECLYLRRSCSRALILP